MLSSVLTSERAVELNILIIRAFVRLREYLATHKDLAQNWRMLNAPNRSIAHTSNRFMTIFSGFLNRFRNLRSVASDLCRQRKNSEA